MAFNLYSDFATGKYKISQNNFTQADLTLYITKFEKRYLQDLLGVSLYNLFIASLVSNVPTGVYLTIYNEFAQDNDNSGFVFQSLTGEILPSVESGATLDKIVRSEGMKEMLKGFIFFEYSRDQYVKNTVTGAVQETNENSNSLTLMQAGVKEKYNEAVNTFNAIQWYIKENLEDYPTFNGITLEQLHW